MIVHAEVFGTRLRSSIADYTIPYQSRLDLDHDFIAKKCQQVVNGIEMFDDKVHQMDSKETDELFYFFKYVKKNLFFIAAIEMVPGLYEDQLEYRFLMMHQQVQKCVRRNYKDFDNLTKELTLQLARSTSDINPSVWSKDDLSGAFGDSQAETDLETAANYKENLHLSSRSWRKLLSKNSPSSYLFPELELASLTSTFLEHRQLVTTYGKDQSWITFFLGNTRMAQIICSFGIMFIFLFVWLFSQGYNFGFSF